MFIRENKMQLFWIVLIASSVKGSSSMTVVTYTNKTFEELLCVINEDTVLATWRDVTTGDSLYTYNTNSPEIQIRDLQPKHDNFRYSYVENNSFNLIIDKLERDDEGAYTCEEAGLTSVETDYHITVEAIPVEFSLDCFVPPDVTCPAQGDTPTSELICTCAAKGVHPDTLYLDISGADNVQQDSPVAKDGLYNLSLKATVPVTDSATEVTCSVKGYNTTEPIPPNLITKTFVISPPTCALEISFDKECKGATLSCSCSAMPTDGESPSDSGIVFSYFNEAGDLIAGSATGPFQINDIEAGVDLTYSCRGCNGLYYGDSSYVTESKVCKITMETTTEELITKGDDDQGGLTTGAKIGISLGAVAVVVVIVVVAVILWKNGQGGSNSSSDKLDDNGAGPRGDPEIPAYGVVDKNRTKDPTPAPRSSMRDSTNPSKPKQDGQMEMQYADLDHGNKPASDEVRKPKEEPTEYATVQSVIV